MYKCACACTRARARMIICMYLCQCAFRSVGAACESLYSGARGVHVCVFTSVISVVFLPALFFSHINKIYLQAK